MQQLSQEDASVASIHESPRRGVFSETELPVYGLLEISAASVSLLNCLTNLPAIPRSLAVGSKSFVARRTSLIAGPLGHCRWGRAVAGLALRLKASVVVQVVLTEQKVGASPLQEEFPLQNLQEVPARAIAEY